MMKVNSLLGGRRTCDRICFQVLFMLLILGPLIFVCEAGAATITFEGYPEGTIITDQYENVGVLFSGTPSSPQINTPPDIFGIPVTASLLALDSITFSFFNPQDNSKVEVDVPYFNTFGAYFYSSSHVITDYYDSEGTLLISDEWNYSNFYGHEKPAVQNVHKIVITKNNLNVWIDDLSFNIICDGTDADGDGHYTPESCRTPNDDCNDNDPTIPGPEDCGDGIDNDCNGKADCIDMECSAEPFCSSDCSGPGGAPNAYVGE